MLDEPGIDADAVASRDVRVPVDRGEKFLAEGIERLAVVRGWLSALVASVCLGKNRGDGCKVVLGQLDRQSVGGQEITGTCVPCTH